MKPYLAMVLQVGFAGMYTSPWRPQGRMSHSVPRRPVTRRHCRHDALRHLLRRGTEAKDDNHHLHQDHGACISKPVLHGREDDLGRIRDGARQHPAAGCHLRALREPPQPGQDRRHAPHSGRRGADGPVPRPHRTIPVDQAGQHHRPRGPAERTIRSSSSRGLGVLHPPVQHPPELPGGARCHRPSPSANTSVGHRLRHQLFTASLCRHRVFRRGVLRRASCRSKGAGVCHGIQPAL
ncbi:hypothetical protein ZWY2020_029488, partial [Hordeum vulgare]